ncbi:MAG: SIMPL domain-containing protein [Vulcanimicrobiaceae bacterium]
MRISVAVLTLAVAALPAAALAQSTQAYPMRPDVPALTVSGNGVVDRSPDEATVSVQIVTNDDNAANSTGKNNTIYNALKTKALGLGLTAEAIRTTYFNVEFIPYPPKNLPPEQRQARYGYVTTRSLALSVTPIENVGKLVDAATATGATNIGSVSFGLKDRRGAYLAALAAAMSDAKAQASTLAAAGGFSLVRIRNVNAGAYSSPQPQPMMRMAAAAAPAPAPPTEIEPGGPVEVDARISVTYDIR